jgi:hypothetical protein
MTEFLSSKRHIRQQEGSFRIEPWKNLIKIRSNEVREGKTNVTKARTLYITCNVVEVTHSIMTNLVH